MHGKVIPGPASGTLQHAPDQRARCGIGKEPEGSLPGIGNPVALLFPALRGICLLNEPGIAEGADKPGERGVRQFSGGLPAFLIMNNRLG